MIVQNTQKYQHDKQGLEKRLMDLQNQMMLDQQADEQTKGLLQN